MLRFFCKVIETRVKARENEKQLFLEFCETFTGVSIKQLDYELEISIVGPSQLSRIGIESVLV